jgi:hypothetical protein
MWFISILETLRLIVLEHNYPSYGISVLTMALPIPQAKLEFILRNFEWNTCASLLGLATDISP